MKKKELTVLELKNVVEEFKLYETNEEIYWGQSINCTRQYLKEMK